MLVLAVELLQLSMADSLNFLKLASTSSDATETNPWLLAHGILFIVNYSIVIPVASYLILRDRDEHDQIHKILGVFSFVLLVLGWASLGESNKATGTYKELDESSVAMEHGATGTAARYILVAVLITGIIVGVMRMPGKIRLSVRIAHGVAGVFLSFFGPVVVWNGWVRLSTVYNQALDSSPIIWLLLSILLTMGLFGERIYMHQKKKKEAIMAQLTKVAGNSPKRKTLFNISDVVEMMKTKLVLIFEDEVLVIPPDWNHPGGNDLLYQYNGKDVTFILDGSEPFQDMGRNRIVPHSAYAFEQLAGFKTGKIRFSSMRSPGGTMRPVLSRQASARMSVLVLSRQGSRGSLGAPPMTNTDKIRAKIVSCEQINKAQDFPVLLYKIHIDDPHYVAGVAVGFKVRLSLQQDIRSLERSYTIVDVDSAERTISFAIKIYPNGQLTSKLKEKKPTDKIYLSYANPCPLVPSVPTVPALLVLIAAGTGMAPMISFYDKCAMIESGGILLWWVRDDGDLFFLDQLKKLMDITRKLKVFLFFTKPPEGMVDTANWNGFACNTGRISGPGIKAILDRTYSPCPSLDQVAFIMSGPRGFISSAIESCNDMGIKNSRILSLD